MQRLLIVLVAISLGSTFAVAKSVSESDCNLFMGKVHPSKEFTKEDSAPYLAKMKAMNMAPKTEGMMSTDDFMTGCKAGAFEGM